MFPPMVAYNCFIPAIESKRKRGHKHRRTSTHSTKSTKSHGSHASHKSHKSHKHGSDTRAHRSHRSALANGSPPPAGRHSNQASSAIVDASLPSHSLPHGHSKLAPLSTESNHVKSSHRAAVSKPKAPVDATLCGQKSCPKRTLGKEAACKKCDGAAENRISRSKSTPESKPPPRRWSIWSWWWSSPKTTEEPQGGWRCFGK